MKNAFIAGVVFTAALLAGCSQTGSPADGGYGGDQVADAGGDAGFAHCGVVYFKEDNLQVVTNGAVKLLVDTARGTFSIEAPEGAVIKGVESRVVLKDGDSETPFGTSTAGKKGFLVESFDDALGCGLRAVLTNTPKIAGPTITARIELRDKQTFVTASAGAAWPAGAPQSTLVLRFSPIVADPSTNGSLKVGADPLAHRILDNGFDLYFDYTARVYMAGSIQSMLFGPGSASNYNMAVFDPETQKSIVAGFLSMVTAMGMVAIDPGANAAEKKTFSRFDGFGYYFDGKPPNKAETGDILQSEIFYLDLAPKTVFDGLELYADRYAFRIGKVLTTDVPTGWNSWGARGGYGSDINREMMLENLADCVTDFLPWEMKYFMIDSGWPKQIGDWDPDPARFPPENDGMKSLADEIVKNKMIPGLWIQPFSVHKQSELAKAHPEWLVKPGGIGTAMVPKEYLLLDLTNPDALEWLRATFEKIHGWGYRWFKVDFTYYAMFMTDMHDPSKTQFEAYRNAISIIREAIGPDSFLVGIAGNGAWMDFADGQRITLDNQPVWGDPPEEQGTKVTYQSIVRKYYMSNRIWINHLDLIFFKQDYGLTFKESRVLASVMALAGGIFKLGDNYILNHEHPEWEDVTHKMLPVYPHSGRPLDLFFREYPEIWDLEVSRDNRSFHVVGLLNWGLNRNIESSEWEPEQARTFDVDLSKMGFGSEPVLAVESWSGAHWWINGGTLSRTIGPRDSEVIVLRGNPSEPAVVHTSRHLLGTAVEVHNEKWDGKALTLSAIIDSVAANRIKVLVAPSMYAVIDVTATGSTGLEYSTIDGVV